MVLNYSKSNNICAPLVHELREFPLKTLHLSAGLINTNANLRFICDEV